MVSQIPDPAQLDPMEKASVDELRAVQLKRLKQTLQLSYDNVAPYRKKCDHAGVAPADLKSLEDLKRFPFTLKSDLRDNYPFGMFAVPLSEVVRIHASSGTTGKPTVVGYTRGDIDMWSEAVAARKATSSMWLTATACSPAAWGHTTVPSGWAPRSSPCPAVRRRSRCS